MILRKNKLAKGQQYLAFLYNAIKKADFLYMQQKKARGSQRAFEIKSSPLAFGLRGRLTSTPRPRLRASVLLLNQENTEAAVVLAVVGAVVAAESGAAVAGEEAPAAAPEHTSISTAGSFRIDD